MIASHFHGSNMRNKLFSFQNGTSNGILHNLFSSPDYWNSFSFSSTRSEEDLDVINAFNFSSTNYWLGMDDSSPNNLSFCFKEFSILANGYSITASHHTANPARAKLGAFSGSNDNKSWSFYEEKEYSIDASETIFVPWTPGVPFRCFQLTCLKSLTESYKNRFDVQSIDLFGYIIANHVTCKRIFPLHLSLHHILLHSFFFTHTT